MSKNMVVAPPAGEPTSGSFLLTQGGVDIAQQSLFHNKEPTSLIWEINHKSPNYSCTVPTSAAGADRGNERLQCLSPVGKQDCRELQTLIATGRARQTAQKIGLWLEASTISHSCVCGHMHFCAASS